MQDEIVRGSCGPVALKTTLGYVLSGPLFQSENTETTLTTCCLRVNVEDQLDRVVEKLWKLDGVSTKDDDDNDVLKKFQESITFNELSGRYQVHLPWRQDVGTLCDNYSQCYRRLSNQLNRFQKNPELFDEYNKVMQEQIDSGVLESVSTTPPGVGEAYYIPHHCVLRRDHTTTRLRVVYDASSKLVGPSLNQCLYEGPCLLPKLVRILMRFRCRKIGIVGDLEKAFLQVEVAKEDRNFLRTLWVKDFDPRKSIELGKRPEILVLRFSRVVFGVRSSPFHLSATFRYHAEKYREKYAHVVQELIDAMYVDDFESEADSVEEGYELFVTARKISKEGGWNLRKFATNSRQLQDRIDADFPELANDMPTNSADDISFSEVTQPSYEVTQSNREQKVLGMVWDKATDTFVYRFDTFLSYSKSTALTKRGLLQLLARVYDPLGLISHIMVALRCTFQQVCKLGIGWDDDVPAAQKFTIRK